MTKLQEENGKSILIAGDFNVSTVQTKTRCRTDVSCNTFLKA